jgi:hypothetical protein
LKILSSAITLLKKSAAPDPGIFREKTHNPTSLRQRNMVIIWGLGVFGEDAMPIFSDNCRHLHCAFKKIRSCGITVFGKFPATQPDFFLNPKRGYRSFLRIIQSLWEVHKKVREIMSPAI